MKNVFLNTGDICFNYVMSGDTTPAVIVIGRNIMELGITGKDGTKFTFSPRTASADPAVILEIEKDGCKKFCYIRVQRNDDGVWRPKKDFTGECYVAVNTEEGLECEVFEVAQFVDME